MRVINTTENPILLDDINFVVPFSKTFEPTEITQDQAARSSKLKLALAYKLLLDADKDVKYRSQLKDFDPNSPFFQKKNKLSEAKTPVISDKPIQMKTKDDDFKTDKLSVIWTGPCYDHGGYARMNRKFMFGLHEKGMIVKYDPLDSINDLDPETMAMIRKLSAARVPNNAPGVFGMTAPLIYKNFGMHKILFTMMETRRLHQEYVNRANTADEIIVPTHWCANMFKESGITRPISVIPLGVDVDIYHPEVEPLDFSKKLKSFVFLSVFGWSLRKGYDVLLKAYLEEFKSDEDVSLLISSRYFGSTDECKKQVIRNDIAKISAEVSNTKQPHVVLFGDNLSEKLMPRLYASCDAFVLISRGEGFSLPLAEAGACGMPVIASDYSGHTDFLNNDCAWMVDVDGYEKADKELAKVSLFYEDAEFPIFGDAAVQQTRQHMRYVFEHQQEAKQKGEKLYKKINEEYTWDVVVNKMWNKINDVWTNVLKP